MKRTILTPEQARTIIGAFDLSETLDNVEAMDLLRTNNPELLEAYQALAKIAESQ